MSQSKTSYGAELRKRTACSRHEQHSNKPETTDDETVEPACRTRAVGRGIDRREWRVMPYNGRTRTFYDPCGWPECYPGGPPNDETETVVRSCREPTTYHRPRDDSEPCEHETDAPEIGTDDTRISQDAIKPIGPIDSLTDLKEGQQVVLEVRERPLHVIEATTEPDGTVGLLGPGGGEYQVERRPEVDKPYYLPKIGYLGEIIRVRVGIPAEAV